MELVIRLEVDNFIKFIKYQCEIIFLGILVEFCGGFKWYIEFIFGFLLKIVNIVFGY